MPNMRVHRTLKVLFDKGASREGTLFGRDYYVVPCVAMVEGVRFGANQTEPELGLASEFGDTPIAWANKPLVLNHPQIDGVYVSANIPEVLESYQFGLTMNPSLDDGKLKMEAWIDTARVEELGGEFKTTLERIQAEEDVEISVGFFSDLEKHKGKFKGQTYGAIWRNIKPDHLAVLSEGIKGACSVEDGCGIPRINSEESKMAKLITANGITVDETTPKGQCSCGGNHTQEEHQDDDAPVTQKGLKSMLADLLKPFTMNAQEKALEAHKEQRSLNEAFVNQAIDSSLMDRDVRAMIQRSLSKERGSYTYLLGYTQDKAIYEDYISGQGYACFQIGINVSDSAVEFVGEPEEVILQTKIVPQADNNTTTDPEPTTQENDMGTEDKTKTVTTPEPEKTVVQEGKKLTAQEYIDQAPAEVKEVLQASLRAHEAKRTSLIKTLTDAKQNKFTEEFLKTQSVEVLENMVALLPGDFAGRPHPTNPQIQSSNVSETVPVVKAFERKTAA